MDDDDHNFEEEKHSLPLLPRHRSPVFSRDEVKLLINLVDKYKSIILNKSSNTAACHAKELTWAKIAKIFNSHGFKHVRSSDCLKMKWDNLKKDARKLSKNLINERDTEFNDFTSQIISMMSEMENNNGEIEIPSCLEENLSESEVHRQPKEDEIKYWEENGERESEESVDDDTETERFKNRSMNFSPQECRLLLKCVHAEKKHIFCKLNTGKAIKLKSNAWSRVTAEYNRLSPQKRSTKVLRTKFTNMKKMVKKASFSDYLKKHYKNKHVKLTDEKCDKPIKLEPEMEDDPMSNDDDCSNEVHSSIETDIAPDPLSTVLNCNTDVVVSETLNPIENKEIVKLKTELLNYQLENAKLERKRLEQLVQAEEADREARATEMALRLRAARLEVVAAEMKLPPTHPALHYTVEEQKAGSYMNKYGTRS